MYRVDRIRIEEFHPLNKRFRGLSKNLTVLIDVAKEYGV